MPNNGDEPTTKPGEEGKSFNGAPAEESADEFFEETPVSPTTITTRERQIATEEQALTGRDGAFSGNPGNPLSQEELRRFGERMDLLERRLSVVEEQEATEPWHGTTMDFLPSMRGSPGIVVDPGVARATPCTRFDLGGDSELVFSKGVIGALDEPQKALLCTETVTKPLSPEQERRLRGWREAAATCKGEIADVPDGEKLEPWLTCMSRELKGKGIEVK